MYIQENRIRQNDTMADFDIKKGKKKVFLDIKVSWLICLTNTE